jgi:hypothetical protein
MGKKHDNKKIFHKMYLYKQKYAITAKYLQLLQIKYIKNSVTYSHSL